MWKPKTLSEEVTEQDCLTLPSMLFYLRASVVLSIVATAAHCWIHNGSSSFLPDTVSLSFGRPLQRCPKGQAISQHLWHKSLPSSTSPVWSCSGLESACTAQAQQRAHRCSARKLKRKWNQAPLAENFKALLQITVAFKQWVINKLPLHPGKHCYRPPPEAAQMHFSCALRRKYNSCRKRVNSRTVETITFTQLSKINKKY